MKVLVGRLVTINQDEYPGLGTWFVQLRDAEHENDIIARVYGDTKEQAVTRAFDIARAINGTTVKEELAKGGI